MWKVYKRTDRRTDGQTDRQTDKRRTAGDQKSSCELKKGANNNWFTVAETYHTITPWKFTRNVSHVSVLSIAVYMFLYVLYKHYCIFFLCNWHTCLSQWCWVSFGYLAPLLGRLSLTARNYHHYHQWLIVTSWKVTKQYEKNWHLLVIHLLPINKFSKLHTINQCFWIQVIQNCTITETMTQFVWV